MLYRFDAKRIVSLLQSTDGSGHVEIDIPHAALMDIHRQYQHECDVEDVLSVLEEWSEHGGKDYEKLSRNDTFIEKAARLYRHAVDNNDDWYNDAEYALSETYDAMNYEGRFNAEVTE